MRKFTLIALFFVVLLASGGCLPPGFRVTRIRYRNDLAVRMVRKLIPDLKRKKVFGRFYLRKYGLEGEFVLVTDTTSMVFYPISPVINTPVRIDSSNFPEFLTLLRDTHEIVVDSAFIQIGTNVTEIYGNIDGLKFRSFFSKDLPRELILSDSLSVEMKGFKPAGTDRFYPSRLTIKTPENGTIDARIDSIAVNPS